MRPATEALAGTLIVVTLVAAGAWFASDPEWPRRFLSSLDGNLQEHEPPKVTINRIDWSADGQKLLVLYRSRDCAEGCLALQDVSLAGGLLIDSPTNSWSTAVLTPDACHLVAGANDRRLLWIATDSSEPPIFLIEGPGPACSFSATAITADGRLVAGGTDAGSICLCDPFRRTCLTLETGRKSSVRELHFSRDGKRLIAAHSNGRATVWDVGSGGLVQEFVGHGQRITGADFLRDGERIITGGADDSVRIWQIASGRELWHGEFGLPGVNTLAVSPDGRTAAWGGFGRRIIVWDLDRGQKRFEIAISAPAIFHLKFSPDGSTLAAAAWEETLRLYDARTGVETRSINVVNPNVY